MKFRSTYPALRFGPIEPGRFIDFVPTKLSEDPADPSAEGRYETTDEAEVAALKAAAERVDYIDVMKRGE